MQSQPDNTLRISSTVKSHSALEPEPQLLPRLMARVGPDSRPDAGPPPQRGLYREVLDLALSTAKHFVTAYGRTVSAKEVHHAACALYFRANQAGLVPVSVARLAQDARMDRKTMARALTVCASLHIARPIRERRQGRVVGFALNVGGLDWPAVYARVRAMFPPSATTVPGASQPALGFPPEPVEKGPQAPSASAEKGPQAPSASAEKGPQAPSASAEKGLQAPSASAEKGPQAPSASAEKGPQAPYRATYVRWDVQDLAVAAGTPVPKEDPAFDHCEQQQQLQQQTTTTAERRQRRIEGLLAAIAARSRDLGEPFDESAYRQRLETGAIDVEDLQKHADRLAHQLKARAEHYEGPPTDCAACGADLRRESFDPAPGCPRCGSPDFAHPGPSSGFPPGPTDE